MSKKKENKKNFIYGVIIGVINFNFSRPLIILSIT